MQFIQFYTTERAIDPTNTVMSADREIGAAVTYIGQGRGSARFRGDIMTCSLGFLENYRVQRRKKSKNP